MKKSKVLLISALACLTIGCGSALAFSFAKTAKEVEGYSTSSLPTTIDLNDTSAANIRSYYSSLNSLSTSERQGNNLLKNLKTILKNGQKYYSYDSGSAIWQIYEIADRDWTKSPASGTTYGTYNSGTNKITGYEYGTSSSAKKNNPYIHALYINRNINNQTTAWDDHQQTQWGINREHVWPKAEGFETSGAGGARGDPMHLMAGNGYSNNIHSNYYYGYVNTSSSYTDCGNKYSNQSGNLLGKSKTLGGSTNVFEPQDCDKGDIARAIFYMVARYNYLSGSDTDGIDSNNPNLALTQSLSDWASSGYSSTTSKQGKMGIMTDLLAWHHADPVDEYEIHRNNLLYTNYTNNRNPFIDYPEWADFIWGSVNYSGSTYISHSTTPTGYATPSTDTINGYNSGSVAVTGVTLNKNSTTIEAGESETLTATVLPSNASNKTVTWTSSNDSVASVSSGVIHAHAIGNATITVKTSDGNKTATCTVTVTASTKTLSSIEVSNPKTTFMVDEDFECGGTVTAHFSNSSTADVTAEATFSGYNTSSLGQQTVQVEYEYAGVTKSTSYAITVTNTATDTSSGSATIASGAATGWTASGTGSAYADGSIKFDGSGDCIYKLDIFSGSVSTNMTNLVVTINGKIWGDPTSSNSYKVEAISGTSGNITSKANCTKTGADVFGGSYKDVDFEMSSGLSGTTGIRITYVTKGGGNLGVAEISWVATYSLPTATSISATVSKTYYVGETISSEDVSVEDNLGNTLTTFSFDDDGYQFTYSDAASGGSLTNKVFTNTITAKGLTCSLTVQVQRKAYESGVSSVSDELNNANTINSTATTYNTWTCSNTTSGAVYSGQSAGQYTTIQLRSKNSNSGIVSTTSGGTIAKVIVSWNSNTDNGKTLNVYGKNSAYSTPSNLYSSGTQGTLLGTIVKGTSTELTVSGSYSYIGLRSNEGAVYLSSVTIQYSGTSDSAVTLSNYIMYEDTNNQCTTKLSEAITILKGLSSAERTTFSSSNDYVISTARERLEAWARHEGKSINYSDGSLSNSRTPFTVISGLGDNNTVAIIVIISIVAITAIGGYFYLRKRKEV